MKLTSWTGFGDNSETKSKQQLISSINDILPIFSYLYRTILLPYAYTDLSRALTDKEQHRIAAMTTFIPSLTLPAVLFQSPAAAILFPVTLGTAIGYAARRASSPTPLSKHY